MVDAPSTSTDSSATPATGRPGGQVVARSCLQRDALRMATEFGWRMLPIIRGTKKPHLSVKRASNDSAVLERWMRSWPECDWAVAAGRTSDVLVLDVDDRLAFTTFLAAIERSVEDLPLTVRARTPSGGIHLYFRNRDGLKNWTKRLPGVDLKTIGGYVLTPGSAGGMYEWEISPEDTELAVIPEWLVDAFERARPVPGSSPRMGTSKPSSTGSREYLELSDLSTRVPKGMRTTVLVSYAGLLRAQGHEEAELRELLQKAYDESCEVDPGDPVDIAGIVKSAMRWQPGVLRASVARTAHVPGDLFNGHRSGWLRPIYQVLLGLRDERRLAQYSRKTIRDQLTSRGYTRLPSARTISRVITKLVRMGLCWRPSAAKLAYNTLNGGHYLLGVRTPNEAEAYQVASCRAKDATDTVTSTSSSEGTTPGAHPTTVAQSTTATSSTSVVEAPGVPLRTALSLGVGAGPAGRQGGHQGDGVFEIEHSSIPDPADLHLIEVPVHESVQVGVKGDTPGHHVNECEKWPISSVRDGLEEDVEIIQRGEGGWREHRGSAADRAGHREGRYRTSPAWPGTTAPPSGGGSPRPGTASCRPSAERRDSGHRGST